MANNTGIKYGGRQTGTPNKLTKELRESLNQIVSKEMEGLTQRLSNLADRERLFFLIKLLPYVIPKPLNDFEEEKFNYLQISNMDLNDNKIQEYDIRQHLSFKCPNCHPDMKKFQEELDKEY